MGLVAGAKIAALGLLLAYFTGSIIGIGILAYNRNRNTEVPFGPYLALGLYISLFWYTPIVDWYTKLFTF
jgi:prepilin signal peptidase PulO-like enzyme (type II secretory pathway)